MKERQEDGVIENGSGKKSHFLFFIFLSDRGNLMHVTENHGVDEGIRK